MTGITELINVPREVQIGGTTLKIRQLKLIEIFGYFSEKVFEERSVRAKRLSSDLEGKEKIMFLKDILDDMPKGENLTNMIAEAMCSMQGVADMIYLASKDFHPDKCVKDIADLITSDNLETLSPIITWVNGSNQTEDSEKEVEDSNGSEKKTG